MPGCSRDAPWRSRASRRRLGSISGASRGVPGEPRKRPEGPQGRLGTPERTPRSARERAEATKIDAQSRPEAQEESFFDTARSWSTVGAIFRRFLSIFGFSAMSANPLKYRACQQNQGFGHSRCESSRSCDATSKNLENRPENQAEIVENRCSGPLRRAFRSTFVARSASVERLGATRADSGRLGATKSVEAGRSGPLVERAGSPIPESPFANSNIYIYIYIYIYI